MTINQLMDCLDDLVPNQYSAENKLRWLNEVEQAVAQEIILPRDADRQNTFTPYGAVDDTELLVPEPYDRLYLFYLETQIHYHNAETGKYNNAAAAFSQAWDELRSRYNRDHPVVGSPARLNVTGGPSCV